MIGGGDWAEGVLFLMQWVPFQLGPFLYAVPMRPALACARTVGAYLLLAERLAVLAIVITGLLILVPQEITAQLGSWWKRPYNTGRVIGDFWIRVLPMRRLLRTDRQGLSPTELAAALGFIITVTRAVGIAQCMMVLRL